MPSSKPERRFRDIVDNIRWILEDIQGVSLKDFKGNRTIQDAVFFRLLRISEAASKLDIVAENLAPNEPWQQIRAFGNALRHEYDSLALDQVWIILQRDLPSLLTSCENALLHIAGDGN